MQAPAARARLRLGVFAVACAAASVCIGGYHPLAEDGGLYVAGVELRLNAALFPYDRAFVQPHLAYSVFAPLLAGVSRLAHAPLMWVVFALFVFARMLLMVALAQLAIALLEEPGAAAFALVVCSACLAMPIAGTSLLLDDPYLTARSFSLPLTVWALALTLRAGTTVQRRHQRSLLAGGCLAVAAIFHPLMAMYGGTLCVAVAIAAMPSPQRRGWSAASAACFAVTIAAVAQWFGGTESSAANAAVHSRYYWFLAQWQWYERLGLIAPVLLLALLAARSARPRARLAAEAAVAVAMLSTVIAICFAQEHFRSHIVARLQPLRCFQTIYVVFLLLLSGWLYRRVRARGLAPAVWVLPCLAGIGMFALQRSEFSRSRQIEFPWLQPRNPWAQAFIWARNQTPINGLFALDSRYVNRPGEDAQVFRATAQRSQLPDFSKDGGEAAITPSLAPLWQPAAAAQMGLSDASDAQRDAALSGFGVTYTVLRADAVTAYRCPYRNDTVKICEPSSVARR